MSKRGCLGEELCLKQHNTKKISGFLRFCVLSPKAGRFSDRCWCGYKGPLSRRNSQTCSSSPLVTSRRQLSLSIPAIHDAVQDVRGCVVKDLATSSQGAVVCQLEVGRSGERERERLVFSQKRKNKETYQGNYERNKE